MKTKNYFTTISDGTELWINRWAPDNDEDVKAVIQLHHGMMEHSLRYDRLGSVLAENGYVLNAFDMRGHGRTAENAEQKGTGCFGMVSSKKGYKLLLNDLNDVINDVKKDYPGKKVIILSHCFGSSISQYYIENYSSQIDGCILCGSSGIQNFTTFFAKILFNISTVFHGRYGYDKFLNNFMYKGFNSKIKNPKSKNSWISKNKLNVEMYDADDWCGIPLRVSYFKDIMYILRIIYKKRNIKKISKDLPIYILYGSDDPVSNYGKNVKTLYKLFEKVGIKNLKITEMKGDRHEILNEEDKEIVENNIISWINSIV